MTPWIHAMCGECWLHRKPGVEALRDTKPKEEVCCFCGDKTRMGIYVKQNPKEVKCKGAGKSHGF